MPSSDSSAETCRDTADCESPSCSPAWVKLPASAAAWKTLSLSQSMINFLPFPKGAGGNRLFGSDARICLAVLSEKTNRLERGHAAHPGRGHGLAIDIVGDVAGRENARDRGRGRIGR